ncbi:MAG: tetratricopeptide repeat protein [Gammaproteobacteria bacterium]
MSDKNKPEKLLDKKETPVTMKFAGGFANEFDYIWFPESRGDLKKKTKPTDDKIDPISASLTSTASGLFDPIVTHATSLPKAKSIFKNGPRLNAWVNNDYRIPSFYTAEGGSSIVPRYGEETVAFRVKKNAKILHSSEVPMPYAAMPRKHWASYALKEGYDAIREEGLTTKPNGEKASHLIFLREADKKLDVTGIYTNPKPPKEIQKIGMESGKAFGWYKTQTAISVPTIRAIQGLGAVGTLYGVGAASWEVAKSSEPGKEALYQGTLLGAAIVGGSRAARFAVLPCAAVGSIFPPAAPFTVPLCLAGAAFGGGYAAVEGMRWTLSQTASIIPTAEAAPPIGDKDYKITTPLSSPWIPLASLEKKALSEKDLDKITGYIKPAYSNIEALSFGTNFYALLDSLSPSGTDSLKSQGQYLLSQVRKSDRSMQKADVKDLVRHPVFQDELNLMQHNGLSWNQTQLLALTASQLQGSDLKISKQPDPQSVKKALDSLESAIKTDFSNPQKSQILGWVVTESKKAASAFSASSVTFLEEKVKGSGDNALVCLKINTACNLASDLAKLTGHRDFARGINKLGQSATGIANGIALMGVHPLLGLGGIAHAIFQFFEDDDNGMEEAFNAIHTTLVHGINSVLKQQLELAQGLSQQITQSHQAAMSRFDQVDQRLVDIQQTILYSYKQLTMQQVHISRQIESMAHQVSEAERNILTGLQKIHSDIVRCLQVVGQSMIRNFTALSEQLTVGLSGLDAHLKNLEYRFGLQMAGYAFMQKQLAFEVLREQRQAVGILLASTAKRYQETRQDFEESHEKQVALKKSWVEKTTSYAERILGKTPPEKIKPDKLTMALEKSLAPQDEQEELSSKTICHEIGLEDQWRTTDPFEVINILRKICYEEGSDFREKALLRSPLPHLNASLINIRAYFKVLKQNEPIKPELLDHAQAYVNQLRSLLYFCHALADPPVIKSLLARAGKSTAAMGSLLEKMVEHYQEEFLVDLRKNLSSVLLHYEITYAHMKSDPDIKDLCAINKKQIEALTLKDLTDTAATALQPLAYMAVPGPGEKSKFALPMHNRLPILPAKLCQLEALHAGSFYFYYTYAAEEKQLTVNYEFQLSTEDKPISLGKKQIAVENESAILDGWREYKPTFEAIKLSKPEEIAIERAHHQAMQQLRIQMNAKIVQAMMTSIPMQSAFENIEADVGVLHMVFKLLFGPYYQYDRPELGNVLHGVLTSRAIEGYLINYNGSETHPYQLLKKSQEYYLKLSESIIESLKNGTLSVSHDALNNALVSLDVEMLHLLPTGKQLAYLETLIKSLPELARAPLYDLSGSLKIQHSLQDAVLDYSTSINIYPHNNAVYLHRADCLILLNQFDRAIADYNRILDNLNHDLTLLRSKKSNPSIDVLKENLYVNIVATLLRRADAYQLGKYYAAALSDYHQLCGMFPDRADFNYRRAYSYECLEAWDQASVLYQQNMESVSEGAVSLEGRARCLTRLGKIPEAFDCYLQLLKQYDWITGLKLQCAMLAKPDDERTHDWLKAVIDDETTSVDDLLACGQVAAKNKNLIVLAQLAYNKAVAQGISTQQQHNSCAEMSARLGLKKAYVFHKQSASKLKPCLDAKPPRPIIPPQESESILAIKTLPVLSLFGNRPTASLPSPAIELIPEKRQGL